MRSGNETTMGTGRNAEGIGGAAAGSATERRIPFSGLTVIDKSLDRVAADIVEAARRGTRRDIYFVNAHCLNVAAADPDYRSLLLTAPGVYADGVGMALGAKINGRRLEHNVNGTDLLPELCQRAAAETVPMALIGARPGIAAACRDRLLEKYPGLDIVSCHHGFLDPGEEAEAIADINDSGARILLVAKGVPMQEHWMAANRHALDVPVVMGVGALFDFYSGDMPRAPHWLRQMRLEWLYRLSREPRRMFARYVLGNPLFVYRMVALRFGRGPLAPESG